MFSPAIAAIKGPNYTDAAVLISFIASVVNDIKTGTISVFLISDGHIRAKSTILSTQD